MKSYEKIKENKTLKTLFFLLFGAIIIGLFFILRFYFWPFLFALILYLALRPFNDKLEKLVRLRSISSAIIIIGLFLVILVPLFFLFVALADQTMELYGVIEKEISGGIILKWQKTVLVKKVLLFININPADVTQKITELIQNGAVSTVSSFTKLLSFPINFTISFFFMILMLFFLLKDGYKLDSVIYETLPFPDDLEKMVVDRLKEVIRVLLAGNLMIMAFQGIAIGVGLSIAGISIPLVWGTIAGVLSLIPVVGTSLIWIPAALVLIFKGAYGWALFLAIWSLVWYLLLENLVKPKVFGKKLNFHPLLFFFLLLGSIQAFNLPGVLIGPILLTLFYSFWEIYKFFDEYDFSTKNVLHDLAGAENSEIIADDE
jgi:predicted PurR-regulated permease PerM